jgi:hypothetical protein
MHWNGKTYYWWTNITNEPNTIKQLRNQYSRCVIGDPVISKTYKTVEMARNNGQLGVYVEDPWEANEEFKTYSNQ